MKGENALRSQNPTYLLLGLTHFYTISLPSVNIES